METYHKTLAERVDRRGRETRDLEYRMDNLVRRVTNLEEERQVQEGRIAVLESEIERLGGKMCRCGERSPIAPGLGTREEPFTLGYADGPEDSDQGSYQSVPV